MANEDLIGGTEVAEALEPQELSHREEQFCVHYVRLNRNGTQAAIAAGYSENGADVSAVRLLARDRVSKRIAQLTEPLKQKLKLDLEETLHQIAAVATFDRRKLFNPDGTKKLIPELDDATAAAISHMGAVDVVPFDKMKALDMAMKHLGGYERDNKQKGENLKINIMLV
jgi:phage terminase small subunit